VGVAEHEEGDVVPVQRGGPTSHAGVTAVLGRHRERDVQGLEETASEWAVGGRLACAALWFLWRADNLGLHRLDGCFHVALGYADGGRQAT